MLLSATVKLADALDPLISEKIAILQPTEAFLRKLDPQEETICPACGRRIRFEDFGSHVASELERLQDVTAVIAERSAATGTLSLVVKALKLQLQKPELASWRENLKAPPKACFEHLELLNPDRLYNSCTEGDLKKVEQGLEPIVAAAVEASLQAPPDIQDLFSRQASVGRGEESL